MMTKLSVGTTPGDLFYVNQGRYQTYRKALALVKRIAEMDEPGIWTTRADGSHKRHCYFCHAFILENDEHHPTCIWLEARKLVEEGE